MIATDLYSYERKYNGKVNKTISGEALYYRPEKPAYSRLKNSFSQKHVTPFSIDKIAITIPSRYMNEPVAKSIKYSQGPVSTRTNTHSYEVDFHREGFAFDGSDNYADVIKNHVNELVKKDIFKIPEEQRIINHVKGTETSEMYEHGSVTDIASFSSELLSHAKVQCIEIAFDFNFNILDMIDTSQITVVNDTTYYSKDGKAYKSNGKITRWKKSSICIYNKGLKEQVYDHPWYRIEFRLLADDTKLLKDLNFLNGNFNDVYEVLFDVLGKKVIDSGIDFSHLLMSIPLDDEYLFNLLSYNAADLSYDDDCLVEEYEDEEIFLTASESPEPVIPSSIKADNPVNINSKSISLDNISVFSPITYIPADTHSLVSYLFNNDSISDYSPSSNPVYGIKRLVTRLSNSFRRLFNKGNTRIIDTSRSTGRSSGRSTGRSSGRSSGRDCFHHIYNIKTPQSADSTQLLHPQIRGPDNIPEP